MNGLDILNARRQARVSQKELAGELSLRGGRNGLVDVEHNLIEVTDAWVYKAIGAIHAIKDRRDGGELQEAAA
jgi:hypothetical protein